MGENHLEVVEKKRTGDYLPASALNADVPPALDAILDKMLARDPADRYQTASELIDWTRFGSCPNISDLSGGASTRISFQPASAPRAIVSTWTQELLVKRMITAATNAKEIRVRSVQSFVAIDQTA